ncbi:adenylyl-sulfate kinase [Candidatus Pelagibacter sp.]|nr:adenylyl-sulfate kinase [Candidatus Pelagibacter sp.]
MPISVKKNKIKKGFVFWITGLSGAGKTSLANLVKPKISKKFGPTLIINGDDLRGIFRFKSYDRKSRLELAKKYSRLCRHISEQGINVIITVVGLFHEIHKFNRKNLRNYIEIYIKSDVDKIIKMKKKNTYLLKNNIFGLDILPQYPKKPHIEISNDFNIQLNKLAYDLFSEIKKLI